MLQSSKWITHRFGGGWATDFGPTAYVSPDQGGLVTVPWLQDAKNTVYEFDGGVHKAPGTAKLNTGYLGDGGSGAGTAQPVRGLYDFWRQGIVGSATQRRVAHAGTYLWYDQADGVFQVLGTSLSDTSIPNYNTFDDLLIIASDASADLPRSWDLTTFQNLAGTPPNFAFSVTHKNHVFAAGVNAQPSRLYFCKPLDPEDWTGTGSGSIDIDPNDGDRITGIASHKDNLWVFKGPYKGSIHRITGSATADFAKVTFVTGLPCPWINSIFKFGDDMGFVSSNGSVHSLKATAAYGDYNNAWLSYPINKYMQESLNHSRSKQIVTATDPNRGQVWIGLTPSGQTTNTRSLIMDYRFLSQNETYPRWSYWDSRAFNCLSLIRDTSRPRLMGGGYNGFVYKMDQTTRSDTGVAINMNVATPALTYGDEWLLKNLADAGVSLNALNNNTLTFTWVRDGVDTATSTVTQGATGGVFDVGLFDTAVFGGQAFVPRFFGIENGGDFRSISYAFSDSADASDLEIHGFMIKITPCGESTENS